MKLKLISFWLPEVYALLEVINKKRNKSYQSELNDLEKGQPIYNSLTNKLTGVDTGLINIFFDSVTRSINHVLRSFIVDVEFDSTIQGEPYPHKYKLTPVGEVDVSKLEYLHNISLYDQCDFFRVKNEIKL